MATLLKTPTHTSKGLIVFTHKEKSFFFASSTAIKSLLSLLKAHYFFAMHWGGFIEEIQETIPYIDFHMASKGVVKFASSDIPFFNYCSRDFIPAIFFNQSLHKHWDIIWVANSAPVKNADQFFKSLKILFQKTTHVKILIICMNTYKNKKALNLWTLAKTLLTEKELKCLTLLHGTTPFMHPINADDMSFFYNSSKVFTLFSDKEGESRVISEALLCGCPVVVKKQLQGGGKDYLNDTNSMMFTTLEEAADCFYDLIINEKWKNLIPTNQAETQSETYTIPKFKHVLETFYEEQNEPIEGEFILENLYKSLPSHQTLLPRSWCLSNQDDLKNMWGFTKFLCHYSNQKFTLLLSIMCLYETTGTFILRVIRKLKKEYYKLKKK